MRCFHRAAPFVGAGLPPETWTTRQDEHEGPNRSEGLLLTDDFCAVMFFSNKCSIWQQGSYEKFHASIARVLSRRRLRHRRIIIDTPWGPADLAAQIGAHETATVDDVMAIRS